ncbi:MAG: sulfate adenylyltransferase, partial [Azonexus sp.]
ATFERIRADFLEFAARLGIGGVQFIPLSALDGDIVVERGRFLDWYAGPTLLEVLESAPAAHTGRDEGFRFPVQYVCRPQASGDQRLHDFRGFMGRVESGAIAVGDAVVVLPSAQRSRVRDIQLGGRSLPLAHAEQSVTLLLDDEIDISRGDMIVRVAEFETQGPALAVRQIDAMLCWLSETPLDPRRKYLIRQTTRETRAVLAGIDYRVDVNSMAQVGAECLAMNDIARVTFKLAQPLIVDSYAANRATGAFIVIDESSNNTVGAGMIV